MTKKEFIDEMLWDTNRVSLNPIAETHIVSMVSALCYEKLQRAQSTGGFPFCQHEKIEHRELVDVQPVGQGVFRSEWDECLNCKEKLNYKSH